MKTETNEIHGENGISISAMLEYLLMPAHTAHAAAIKKAAKFIEAEREARIARNHAMMLENMEYISESEWSRIVD